MQLSARHVRRIDITIVTYYIATATVITEADNMSIEDELKEALDTEWTFRELMLREVGMREDQIEYWKEKFYKERTGCRT